MDPERGVNVGQLIEMLKSYPADAPLLFGGGLDFYRLKQRGDRLVQVEFNQSVYRLDDGTWTIE